MIGKLDELVFGALEQKKMSAAQVLVASSGRLRFFKCYGEAGVRSFFDLSSLTKPLATALMAMRSLEEGLLSLDDPVEKFFPGKNLVAVSIRSLLNHSSPLVAWRRFYPPAKIDDEIHFEKNHQRVLHSILHEKKCLRDVSETKVVYSDLGYILLAAILEKVWQKDFANIFYDLISTPLGLKREIFFLPRGKKLPFAKKYFVPTQFCLVRKRLVQAEVMDLNCYHLGGVSGHAGLFSGALAVHWILQELRRAKVGKSRLFGKKTFDIFCKPAANRKVSERYFKLGFDTPTQPGSLTGKMFSKNTIGHWGYSGTGFWWDLDRDLWVITLMNHYRFHNDSRRMTELRPRIHDLLLEHFAA